MQQMGLYPKHTTKNLNISFSFFFLDKWQDIFWDVSNNNVWLLLKWCLFVTCKFWSMCSNFTKFRINIFASFLSNIHIHYTFNIHLQACCSKKTWRCWQNVCPLFHVIIHSFNVCNPFHLDTYILAIYQLFLQVLALFSI